MRVKNALDCWDSELKRKQNDSNKEGRELQLSTHFSLRCVPRTEELASSSHKETRSWHYFKKINPNFKSKSQ